jgi:hypothetical protein
VRAGRFEQALRHAVTGCEKYQRDQVCADVARLPRLVANRHRPIAPIFAVEVERLARRICLSDMRIADASGKDVSAITCGQFAHQFILAARHDEWESVAVGGLQWHFELFYEPNFAILLYQAACMALAHADSCRQSAGLGASLEPRDGATRHARADAALRELNQMVAGLRRKYAATAKKMKMAESSEVAAQELY